MPSRHLRSPGGAAVRYDVDKAIVEGAESNQTDGYRMVTAFVRRLGIAVNRKLVLRVMRERRLIQQRRPLVRRKRPCIVRVERPRQLWQLEMSSAAGTYLMAIIDCCTRAIAASQLELRRRADEAIQLVERPAALHGIEAGANSPSAPTTAWASPPAASEPGQAELGIRRPWWLQRPESQAFIESWFRKLNEREVWPNEYETLDDTRGGIGGYVDRYHYRPHGGLDYRTPLAVRQTWEDQRLGPELSTRAGSRSGPPGRALLDARSKNHVLAPHVESCSPALLRSRAP